MYKSISEHLLLGGLHVSIAAINHGEYIPSNCGITDCAMQRWEKFIYCAVDGAFLKLQQPNCNTGTETILERLQESELDNVSCNTKKRFSGDEVI